MNDKKKALARILFENKVRKSDGQAFEDLFVSIMQRANSSFTPIKAQGRLGDKKNDGYIRADGVYYQVFAPQDIRQSFGEAVKKLRKDFEGLKAYWDTIHPIREFYFVVNDKYYGSHPTVEKDLEAIKQEYDLHKCEPFLAMDLENVLFSLPYDIIMSTVGFVPELEAVSESARFSSASKATDADIPTRLLLWFGVGEYDNINQS